MAEKWKPKDCYTYWGVENGDTGDSFVLQHEEDAIQLAPLLNELEAYREERRWRKIGEEWPEDGQECQLADEIEIYIPVYQYKVRKGFYICCGDASLEPTGGIATHWRPAPTDAPVAVKEEG